MFPFRKAIQQLSTRHGQKKSPFFLVEGERCCREALIRRPDWIACIVVSASFVPAESTRQALNPLSPLVETVSEREFETLAVTENPQGILCLMEKPRDTRIPQTIPEPFCLVLDNVREPGNMGSILRTAWAAGLSSVWLTDGCVEVFSPKVVRSGMGAQFAVETFRLGSLEDAVAHFRRLGGVDVWCTMPQAGVSIFSQDFTPCGAAVVLGNEANGISTPDVGRQVTIPMPGNAESLNVAQAATLFIFEAVRRNLRKP